MVGEKDPRSNHCRMLPAILLKTDGSNSLQAKDCKATKPKSYMNPTTSFMAKMSRSISVGENLCLDDSAETKTEGEISLQVPEKTLLNVSGDAEKNKPLVKENGPVKPALQQATNSLSPKSFHSKLTSNRAHLILDIPKPLPDKPTLASFSPTAKSKTLESPQSPAGAEKKKHSFPEGRTPKMEGQVAVLLSPGKDCPASPCTEILKENQMLLKTEVQFEPGVTNSQTKEFSDELSPKFPEDNVLGCAGSIASSGCVADTQRGFSPLEQSRLRSSTTVVAPAEDSGVHGYPSLNFFPLLSPVLVNRFTIPSHFFTSSFWPVSSCLHLSRSISHPFNGGSSISIEQCKHVVSELQDSMRKAIHLYHVVSADLESSADKNEMAGLLTDTFSLMKKELDSLKDGKELQKEVMLVNQQDSVVTPLSGEESNAPLSIPRHFGDEQTLALLEQYSKLLLQAVERRMDKKL